MRFIFVCWSIFIVYWIVSGAMGFKPVKERPSRASRLGAIFLFIFIILFVPGINLFRPSLMNLNTRLLPDTFTLRVMGDAMALIGLAIASWARTVLGSNWSGLPTFREGHELIERGPYRYVRHPIYGGLTLMLFGTAIVSGRAIPFLATIICFVIYWRRMRQEEALLTRHFPEAYPAYKSRTKALIPFLF